MACVHAVWQVKWNGISVKGMRSGSPQHADDSASKFKEVGLEYSEPFKGSRVAVISTS